jgi:hypothetical protein
VGILLLFLAVPSSAQAPSQNSISIGDFGTSVRLTLGMPKDAALRSLRRYYDLTAVEPESFAVQSKTNPDLMYADVAFKGDSLSDVTKYWDINGPDRGVSVVRAIYGAVSAFGGPTEACKVATFDRQEPTMEKRGVIVSCGRRKVSIFTNRWSFTAGSGEDAVVNEELTSER